MSRKAGKMAMDWAEQQARKALQPYRKGAQISASCVEVYEAVAQAIREARNRGEADAKKHK